MREILFRGKRKDNGEWVKGYVHKMDGYGTGYTEYGIQVQDIPTSRPWSVLVQRETIGQFTGLYDKNGKKIFEGDIVKSCEYDDVYYVKYFEDDNYPAFDVVNEINVECNGLSHLYFVEGIEVIGNIHDNPELLAESEDEG